MTTGALMAVSLMLLVVAGLFISSWVSLMNVRAMQVSFMEDFSRRRVALETSRQLGRELTYLAAFQRNSSLAAQTDFLLDTGEGSINSADGWSGLNLYSNTFFPALSTGSVYPYNYTGFRPGAAYYSSERLTRPSESQSGVLDDFESWHFFKSMSPLLAGDLFCVYRKPEGVTTALDIHTEVPGSGSDAGHIAKWIVQGRTVIRHAPSLFVPTTPSPLKLPFQTKSLYVQSQTASDTTVAHPIYGTAISTGGGPTSDLLPSNLPATLTTTGPVDSSTGVGKSYDGYLNVINNSHNPDNSLWNFQAREAAAGRNQTDVIDVFVHGRQASVNPPAWWMYETASPTYPPPNWPSGYEPKLRILNIVLGSATLRNLRISGVVNQIVFVGQSNTNDFKNASKLQPVIITILPDGSGRWIRDIRFERENSRRHVLAFKSDSARDVDLNWINAPLTGDTHRWRCMFINEYHTLFFNMPGNATRNVHIYGGIMTNWTVKRRAQGSPNPSRLVFRADEDPSASGYAPEGPAFSTFLPREAWQETYFRP